MYRLFHDFNNISDSPVEGMVSAPLVCRGTHEDLQKFGLTLSDGMKVLLYQADIGPEDTPDFLEVAATIRYDKRQKCFCADFIHDDLMYQTERKKKEVNKQSEPTTTNPLPPTTPPAPLSDLCR